MDWIHLAQNRGLWEAFVKTIALSLHKMSDKWLLKDDSAPRSSKKKKRERERER
jgi:hypothetical protein